jgi:pimeloyl-ACP methyl ester carboxylesterase
LYTTSNGYRINYEVAGDGQPLLLVPGLLSCIKDYHKYGYIDALRDRFRVITMDYPGSWRERQTVGLGGYTRPTWSPLT